MENGSNANDSREGERERERERHVWWVVGNKEMRRAKPWLMLDVRFGMPTSYGLHALDGYSLNARSHYLIWSSIPDNYVYYEMLLVRLLQAHLYCYHTDVGGLGTFSHLFADFDVSTLSEAGMISGKKNAFRANLHRTLRSSSSLS